MRNAGVMDWHPPMKPPMYALHIPTVHAFGSLSLTNTILAQTHIHDVSTPWHLYPPDDIWKIICLEVYESGNAYEHD